MALQKVRGHDTAPSLMQNVPTWQQNCVHCHSQSSAVEYTRADLVRNSQATRLSCHNLS